MPLLKSEMEQGKELVGQGRLLAQAARGENWSNVLDTNQDRLRAASASAKRLMAGTQMQNKAQQQQQAAQVLQPKGGLAQLMAEKGASPSMVKDVQKIEDTPGGKELLYTQAAQELMKSQGVPQKDVKKIRLYKIGGYVERAYAEGGKVKAAAARARSAGRGEDEMLVHMTEEELGIIKGMWGEPDTNPNTGLPEYGFFSKIWKGIKKVVKKVVTSKIFQVIAPIALSIFVPGLGAMVGGMLAPGASVAVQGMVGSALVRGGLSAAGGGDFVTGAVSGAISGGLGSLAGEQVSKVLPGLSDRTAEIVGSSLASGAGSSLTGGDFVEGALMGATGEMMRPVMEGVTEKGRDILGFREPLEGEMFGTRQVAAADLPEGELGEIDLSTLPQPRGALEDVAVGGGDKQQQQPAVTPATGGAEGPNLLEKYALPAIMAAGALGGGEYEEGEPPPLPEGWNDPLPLYEMNRQFQGMDPESYYTYGQTGAAQSGQHLFMQPEPFAGVPTDPTTPTPGAGGAGNMQAMIAAGQPVPANMVGVAGTAPLTQAGYTQDPNTGNWNPPQQLGQGMPQARGGYQRGGEFDYWSQNADVPRVAPTVSAQGRYVKGAGTGRSDDIPARLSDGEYVMDAETVALLGDGSGSAGAQRLDEMRKNLRKHKAQNLQKGGFSHKAKTPHQYMARGGMAKLRRAMTAAGRV
jgi:hypothetical protein